MRHLLLALGVVLSLGADFPRDPPPGVKPIRFELHPARPQRPALRFTLLPELRDQKPGNAAPHYRAAAKQLKETLAKLNDGRVYERLARWADLPLDRFPREQARAFMQSIEPCLRELADATRHEYVDWELTEKAREFGFNLMLPHLQELRGFATVLSVRTRLAMADNRIEDAVHDLQSMFAMARHSSRGPGMICPLVGIAIATLAANQVDQLLQLPAASNYYWALCDLPRPFIDLRHSLQGERLLARGSFPQLPQAPQDAAAHILKPAETEKVLKTISELQPDSPFVSHSVYMVYVALDMQQKHEWAKRELVEVGWPRETLERMPHVEVGMLHGLLDYDRYLDEIIKCDSLPYWQAAPALFELEKKQRFFLGLNRYESPAIPVSLLLGSNFGRIYSARTRVERKIAALRCVEAIRLFAAGHEGRLPRSLAEIKEVSVPVDSFTGQPFEYEVNGDKATLYGVAVAPPIPNAKPQPATALFYQITMKR